MREPPDFYVLLCWDCKTEFSQSCEQLYNGGVRNCNYTTTYPNAYLFWEQTTIRCPICDGQQLILCGHDLLEIVQERLEQAKYQRVPFGEFEI